MEDKRREVGAKVRSDDTRDKGVVLELAIIGETISRDRDTLGTIYRVEVRTDR